MKSTDVTHNVWYEILEVKEQEIILRVPYGGEDYTDILVTKTVSYINDDTLVLVDCLGIQNSLGEWVKTASDVVKHIVRDYLISFLF